MLAKVKQELPGKILNLLIRQKYIQLKSDQRLVGQNTIITTTGIELNIPFATRRSSSSPRAASDLLTRLRGQRDPQRNQPMASTVLPHAAQYGGGGGG